MMLPPFEENLTALSKRFVKTLRSCLGSPFMGGKAFSFSSFRVRPALETFVLDANTALLTVAVSRYVLVTRFQKIFVLDMDS